MNELDKEKLNEKDIKAVENRIRHAFNQGYEAGLKHGKEQEPCEDCISRQAVLDGIEELKKSPWATDKRGNGFEYLITEALDVVAELCIKREPPVNPQEPKADVLDKIKAEIKDIIQWYMDHGQEDCSQVLTSAIEIIDKYRERYTE